MQLKSRYNRAHGLKKKMREEGLTEAEENQLQELESSYKIGSKLNDMKRALRRAREFESSSLAAVYSNDVLSNIDILRHLKNFDPDKSSFRIDDQNRHIYPLPSSLAKKLGEGWEFCLNEKTQKYVFFPPSQMPSSISMSVHQLVDFYNKEIVTRKWIFFSITNSFCSLFCFVLYQFQISAEAWFDIAFSLFHFNWLCLYVQLYQCILRRYQPVVLFL